VFEPASHLCEGFINLPALHATLPSGAGDAMLGHVQEQCR
jgi:hypothetical protein